MSITAILVTFNSANVISQTLERCTAQDEIDEIIVIDNASSDTTCEQIEADFPAVKLIRNKGNLGFGCACNQGLVQATTEYALLLNPDAEIGSGITSLKDALISNPNAAIAVPLLSSGLHTEATSIRSPALSLTDDPVITPTEQENIFSIVFANGAIALWRMSIMRKVGFFDPAFFLFYEDDDLSIRIKKAGFDILLVAGVFAKHEAGTSCELTDEAEKAKCESLYWSKLYLKKKYCGYFSAVSLALRMWQEGKRRLKELEGRAQPSKDMLDKVTDSLWVRLNEEYDEIHKQEHLTDEQIIAMREQAHNAAQEEFKAIWEHSDRHEEDIKQVKAMVAAAKRFLRHPNRYKAHV